MNSTTDRYCGPPSPHTARFGYLASLCFAIGRWLFSWAGHEWNVADDIEGTAARVVQIVTAR